MIRRDRERGTTGDGVRTDRNRPERGSEPHLGAAGPARVGWDWLRQGAADPRQHTGLRANHGAGSQAWRHQNTARFTASAADGLTWSPVRIGRLPELLLNEGLGRYR